tara:strand:+ start:1169 stop:1591 length:423 start_codon:yes stop_codon:yes gene_type:complete
MNYNETQGEEDPSLWIVHFDMEGGGSVQFQCQAKYCGWAVEAAQMFMDDAAIQGWTMAAISEAHPGIVWEGISQDQKDELWAGELDEHPFFDPDPAVPADKSKSSKAATVIAGVITGVALVAAAYGTVMVTSWAANLAFG